MPVLRASRLRFFVLAAGAAAVGLAGAACQGSSYPRVDCHQPVWVAASEDTSASVIGSWDGWQAPGIAALPSGHPGWQLALLALPPGSYGYQVVTSGVVGLDPYEPLTTFRGDEEVSLLVAPDCSVPALQVASASADATGALSVTGTFSATAGGPMRA